MHKVLIVEDDLSMSVALRDGFQYEGWLVTVAGDGLSAWQAVSEKSFDLVILDVMLPKMSGLDVCKRIRSTGSNLPIIMLTARGQEIDKVVGLRTGADDYVTKPFSFMELMARVEALMRRAAVPWQQTESAADYLFGEVSVNFARLEAFRHGQPFEMTPREFRILKYFIEHRGEIVTRDQLLDEVWSYDHAPLTRTVDVHIAKLRRKIEDDPENPAFLITIHGAGYKFLG